MKLKDLEEILERARDHHSQGTDRWHIIDSILVETYNQPREAPRPFQLPVTFGGKMDYPDLELIVSRTHQRLQSQEPTVLRLLATLFEETTRRKKECTDQSKSPPTSDSSSLSTSAPGAETNGSAVTLALQTTGLVSLEVLDSLLKKNGSLLAVFGNGVKLLITPDVSGVYRYSLELDGKSLT